MVAGLALWRLPAFSVPAPFQVRHYVFTEMFVSTPLTILCYLSVIYHVSVIDAVVYISSI